MQMKSPPSPPHTHLEGDVDGLHRRLKQVTLHLASRAGPVAVEGEALALHIHLLQLALVTPAAVLNSQVHVGRVRA